MQFSLDLIKCHGSGNDFFIIDETVTPLQQTDRVEISKLICNRNNELGGSDGVLFYLEPKDADSEMKMFNPDGTQPEMCGNGIRCHARYAFEKNHKSPMIVKTPKAKLNIIKNIDIYPGIPTYETDIAPVSFEPDTISSYFEKPIINASIPNFFEEMRFTAISVPNPHLIRIVDEIDEDELIMVGKAANSGKPFSAGINVSFVKKIDSKKIFVMTYERGVGITNACGTAMSASTYVSAYLNLVPFLEYIDVCNKGGKVQCKAINEKKPVIKLNGNATYTNQFSVNLNLNEKSILVLEKKQFGSEIRLFEKLKETL